MDAAIRSEGRDGHEDITFGTVLTLAACWDWVPWKAKRLFELDAKISVRSGGSIVSVHRTQVTSIHPVMNPTVVAS